jgi:hypothetical protein
MNPTIENICDELRSSGIIGKPGSIIFELGGICIDIDNKDVMGGILQSWLGAWFESKNFDIEPDLETQKFPDFNFSNGMKLELKTFDSEKGPAFDIANFNSYVRSLLKTPERLDFEYLVLSYKFVNTAVSIEQVWAKKVWELCGSSETNVLNLQKKNGVVYNIRPKNWYNKGVDIFKSRRDFVKALSGAITKFGVQDLDGLVWFDEVSDLYLKRTGFQL